MKPDYCTKINVDSDLSVYAVTDAYNKLFEKVYPEATKNGHHSLYWSLVVPSQTVKSASLISAVLNIPIQLSLEYDVDEWSLEVWYIDSEYISVKSGIWSPGA